MSSAKKDAPKTYPPLLPGALRGGVAIWILLFRDHLKKASRMLAEARATLASVAFLRSYDSDVVRAGQSEGKTSPSGDLSHDSDVLRAGQSEGQTPPSDDLSHNSNALRAGQSEGQTPLFDDLHTVVAQHISTIGELQEAIRDDLIVLQSLFTERPVFDKRAPTVDGPSPTEGNSRVFLRSRPSDQPTVGERYEVALWVLFDDTPRNAIKSLYNVARQRADLQSTGATTKLKAVMDWLRRQEDEDSAQRRARARGAEPSRLDRTLRGQFASERAKLLRLVLDLQGQPYCQPARVRHWRGRAPRTSDWQELDKVLCALVDITIEDGRMGRLLERICQMAAEGSPELVHIIPFIFQRKLAVKDVKDVATNWRAELPDRGIDAARIPDGIAEDVRELLFSPTAEDDETWLLDFVLQRISSPAGEALRKEIVELVIDIADECWLRRASGVLQARSELITRGSAAMSAGYLDPIHSSFFAKAARRHQEFEDQLASLRQIVQAAEERANLIHPGFPAVPRYHLRDREQVERVMLEMIKNFKDQVQEAAALILDRDLLPKLTIEVSFDLCFGSEIRFVRYMSRVFGVVLVVPFNVLRAPRLLGALAHELAHALISNAMIEDLLHGDGPSTMAGWRSPAGGVLTYAGAELAKTYRDYGIEVATPASIIAESLADFMALLTVGPSYVYTLFFSTVGLSAIPSDPTRVAVSTEINPMVRVGVLLRLVDKLWPKRADVEAAAAPKATPGAWKIEWLRPVREAWESYFRMFDQAGYEGDIRELRRRDCFLSEVKIIGSAFCLIVELTKHRAPAGTQGGEPESQSPSKLESWSDFVVPSGQAAEVAALFDEIGASEPIPRRKRAQEGRQHSERAAYSVVAKSAAVHLLWCKHLAEFDRALDLVDAEAPTSEAQFDMSLHAAIWTRPSEVRGLLQFLEAAGREGEGSAQRMADSVVVSGQHEETVHQKSVGEPLSLAQIDCMWTSATDVELGALKTDFDDDTYVVIGPYDFLRVRRAFGAEDLSRRRNAPADDLPVRPVRSYSRVLDYRIIREGPKANDRLAALLQIKIDAVDDPPLPEDELCNAPGDSAPKSVASRFVLRGLGWDDYAFFVCFDTFHDLAAYWIALEGWFATRKRTIRYRTIGILHRIGLEPPEPNHDWRSVLKGRLRKGGPDMLIGYVVKLRTGRWSPDAENKHPSGRTYEEKLKVARAKLEQIGLGARGSSKVNPLSLELRACSGLDDLELRCTLCGAPDEPLDKNECLASVSLYLEVARAVGEIFEVFDAQTTVLLPDGF